MYRPSTEAVCPQARYVTSWNFVFSSEKWGCNHDLPLVVGKIQRESTGSTGATSGAGMEAATAAGWPGGQEHRLQVRLPGASEA